MAHIETFRGETAVSPTNNIVKYQRMTYTLGGRLVAVRVVGFNGSGVEQTGAPDTGLFYLLTDHLGSVVQTVDDSGTLVGNVIRYDPFGDYRAAPTGGQDNISDRSFTGHRSNNSSKSSLGLIYMRARFYVPGIGRFASADTIVPNPMNPQQYNRYTYSLNNPVRFTDPSGHRVADANDGFDPLPEPIDILNPNQRRVFGTTLQTTLAILMSPSNPDEVSRLAATENYHWLFDPRFAETPEGFWDPLLEIFPDAAMVGISGSGTGPSAVVGGEEVLVNFETGQWSVFGYMGQGTGYGLEVDASIYFGLIWNLEENASYAGLFDTVSVDLSATQGFQGNAFWVPGTTPLTGDTWGFSTGYIFLGGGAAGAYTETFFVCQLGCS